MSLEYTLHALSALDPSLGHGAARKARLALALASVDLQFSARPVFGPAQVLPFPFVTGQFSLDQRWTDAILDDMERCVPCGGTGKFLEDAHQDEVPCRFCDGTGSIRVNNDPQHDRDCAACHGNGSLPPAELEKAEFEATEAAAAFDPSAYEGC